MFNKIRDRGPFSADVFKLKEEIGSNSFNRKVSGKEDRKLTALQQLSRAYQINQKMYFRYTTKPVTHYMPTPLAFQED